MYARARTVRSAIPVWVLLGLVISGLTVQARVDASELALHDVPRALAVREELPPPPEGTLELRFRDFFRMPVGPRGLEPGEALLAADGKKVRVVGFMVREASPSEDGFLLSPLPVADSDVDEGLADDIPPATLRVAFTDKKGKGVPYLPGLIRISGTLHLEKHVDAQTQRVSAIQLVPDARTRRALSRAAAKPRATRRNR